MGLEHGIAAYTEAEPGRWTLTGLGREFGVDRTTVRQVVERLRLAGHDVVLRHGHHHAEAAAKRQAEARRLHAEGLSLPEVADALGVGVATVYDYVPPAMRRQEPPAAVAARHLASEFPGRYSVRELAEMFDCTERNVRTALARYGLSDLVRRAA